MPKRQLPLQADLAINHLRWEEMVERQRSAFDNDDDAPRHDFCPTSNPQSRRKAVQVYV